jgi:hypothetical protein
MSRPTNRTPLHHGWKRRCIVSLSLV